MAEKDGLWGMKFPPEIHPVTGRFIESGGNDSIREALYIILMTQQTERFTRPDFGSRMLSYPFMDPSETRLHMMEQDIKSIILMQEPRISEANVKIVKKSKEAKLNISIEFTAAVNHQKGSLELPFPY